MLQLLLIFLLLFLFCLFSFLRQFFLLLYVFISLLFLLKIPPLVFMPPTFDMIVPVIQSVQLKIAKITKIFFPLLKRFLLSLSWKFILWLQYRSETFLHNSFNNVDRSFCNLIIKSCHDVCFFLSLLTQLQSKKMWSVLYWVYKHFVPNPCQLPFTVMFCVKN